MARGNGRKGRLGKARAASTTTAASIQGGGAKGFAQEMAKVQGGKGYGVCFAPTLREKGVK